jgi:phage shock protein E
MKSAAIAIIIFAVAGLIIYNFLTNSNQQMDEQIDITPAKFGEMIKSNSGVVIDVRTEDEYQNGHLSLASHQYDLLNGEFEAQLDSLDKDKTYYLYCRSGNRSGQAARLMKKNGFENVYNVGGFKELADEGFETR